MGLLKRMFRGAEENSAISRAVGDGNLEVAKALLERDRSLVSGRIDKDGWTPLHLAARRYSKPMVELLLANGADANARDSCGATPLHYVDTPALAEVLLAHGADINARTNDGWTPLDTVVYEGQGHEDIIDFLRQRGGREAIPKPGNPFSNHR